MRVVLPRRLLPWRVSLESGVSSRSRLFLLAQLHRIEGRMGCRATLWRMRFENFSELGDQEQSRSVF